MKRNLLKKIKWFYLLFRQIFSIDEDKNEYLTDIWIHYWMRRIFGPKLDSTLNSVLLTASVFRLEKHIKSHGFP